MDGKCTVIPTRFVLTGKPTQVTPREAKFRRKQNSNIT